MLKDLCIINGTSGCEDAVREYIISQIDGKCDYSVDNLGSIIARVGNRSDKIVSINSHMDEVGFIVTGITDEGYLRFDCVGGIDPRVCLDRAVVTENGIKGIIGDKAFHQLSKDERDACPSFDKLLIDIGASSIEQAQGVASPGDFVFFESDYVEFGDDFIKAKALDDRIGCQVMIDLINDGIEATYCFNVQEEVGLRGAKCTANRVNADIAIVIDSTTASDIDAVSGSNRVCVLGEGPAVSFMDNRTIYDKDLYDLAFKIAKDNNIPIQPKTAVAGGNDAGAIQTTLNGVKVLAISNPTRYIHSASSVAKKCDIESMKNLLKELIPNLYDI